MSEGALVASRLGLYLDLALLFGLPVFAVAVLRAGRGDPPAIRPLGGVLLGLALAGLVLSGLHFLMLTAAMAGTGLADVDPALVSILLSESAVGRALVVRAAALLLAACAGFAAARGRRPGLPIAAGAGGIALATLAWGGHAAATEGAAAPVHLAADIAHLLAAGAWMGALFALLLMIARARTVDQTHAAQRALHGFSTIGITAVATLVISGSISAAILLGLPSPAALLGDPYGRLLALKLGLFLLMLMLAALNRSRLTPRLADRLATGDVRGALNALRLSLAVETSAALIILGLVARLGMLPPTGSEF